MVAFGSHVTDVADDDNRFPRLQARRQGPRMPRSPSNLRRAVGDYDRSCLAEAPCGAASSGDPPDDATPAPSSFVSAARVCSSASRAGDCACPLSAGLWSAPVSSGVPEPASSPAKGFAAGAPSATAESDEPAESVDPGEPAEPADPADPTETALLALPACCGG